VRKRVGDIWEKKQGSWRGFFVREGSKRKSRKVLFLKSGKRYLKKHGERTRGKLSKTNRMELGSLGLIKLNKHHSYGGHMQSDI